MHPTKLRHAYIKFYLVRITQVDFSKPNILSNAHLCFFFFFFQSCDSLIIEQMKELSRVDSN